LAVVPVPGSAADPDDIIDAEIVEDPPHAPPAAQPAAPKVEPQVGPESAPEAANIPFAAPPVPAVPVDPITDYTDDGVPTFSYLQDKVEKRYATALGSHELADATIPQVQQAAKRREELAKSAEERLAEIRRSLHPDG
jgi:hypothetical protein